MRSGLRSLISLALLVLEVAAPGTAQAQQFQPKKYTDPQTNQILEYNVVVPTGYDASADKQYPLLVCLHAASNVNPPNRTLSSDGKCWVPQLMSADAGKNPSFYMIPISQSNSSGWGDAGPGSPITQAQKFEGRLTVVVIKELLSTYKIDPDRLYILGPSMGARGSWDIVRRNPGMFAAAAPAAGPASAADAQLYLKDNIWSINGQTDSTAQDNRTAIAAIRAAGGNPIHTELANRGHDTWRTLFVMPEFVAWMFAQRRGVPWWTHPPSVPSTYPMATLTGPAVVPPANLPQTFPGSDSAGMAGSGGAPMGAGGTGGAPMGAGGAASAGAHSGGAAGQGGGSGPSGTGGANVAAAGGGGEVNLPSAGGSSTVGGALGTGGSNAAGGSSSSVVGGAPAAGGAPISGGTPGAPPAAGPKDERSGCSYAPGPCDASDGAAGLLLLALLARGRRPRRRRALAPEARAED